MAGLPNDPIKGFHVLHRACQQLWKHRNDFRLLVTGDPPGPIDEFTRFIGWQSQSELPTWLRLADIVVMPTIAQEGLGRTTVEAMAVGRPVIASRIGGLPYTVQDGVTGRLFEAGNSDELCLRLNELLSDPDLRARMGQAGRTRFEREFTWSRVIQRYYRPLLCSLAATPRVRRT
jgi:glycosyltransferase involved in cell wall biosynthesis